MNWANIDGTSIYYEISGAGALPAVLVHELGGNCRSWDRVTPALAKERQIIAFDQRGSGWSEKPTVAWSIDRLTDDLDLLTAALIPQGRFHLLGLAMGAVVAARYASRHAARLSSLVLCDGTPGLTPEARDYVVTRAIKVRQAGMAAVVDPSLKNSFPSAVVGAESDIFREYRGRFLANDPNGYANASLALAADAADVTDHARIACPTLVLSAEHDFIWPPEVGRQLAQSIPGAEFQSIPNSGHFPPLQAPDSFGRLAKTFWAGTEKQAR